MSNPEDEADIAFQEMIEKVRIYFEVAQLIEGLSPEVYDVFVSLEEDILMGDADEDEVESIIYTVAEALSPPQTHLDW